FAANLSRSSCCMARILKAKEWKSRATPDLARGLLGRVLATRLEDGAILRRRIVETEAYDGQADLACHASRGRTARTAVMFGPAGGRYAVPCYGAHGELKLVAGPAGPAA